MIIKMININESNVNDINDSLLTHIAIDYILESHQYELFEKGIISATICQEPEKQGDMPLGILFDYFAYGKNPEPVNYTKSEIKISQSLYTS